LLVVTVSQAGMFFWFAMTTMIAVPMYLFASFACLVMLTRNNRGALSKVRVKVTADTNRLILFNDRFSSNWEAHWNGNSLQIQRANSLFMLVEVPKGQGELTFDFRPRQFIFLSKVSSITAEFVLLLASIVWYKRLKRRQTENLIKIV
jgi:uncharacterized membrane protein YfhO